MRRQIVGLYPRQFLLCCRYTNGVCLGADSQEEVHTWSTSILIRRWESGRPDRMCSGCLETNALYKKTLCLIWDPAKYRLTG